MRPVCTYTDYFVICTGQNPRQTKAIVDEVAFRLKKDGRVLPKSIDGEREGTWVIADYLDVVLHVFTPDTRELLPARRPLVRRTVGRSRLRLTRLDFSAHGAVAQLGERLAGSQKVRGSIPLGSTFPDSIGTIPSTWHRSEPLARTLPRHASYRSRDTLHCVRKRGA